MQQEPKKTWESIRIQHIGLIGTIINIGGGKLSAAGGDPGEPRKQRGGDG